MVKPSGRKQTAQHYVHHRQVTVRLACQAFRISQTCYRYEPQLSDENRSIKNLKTYYWNVERELEAEPLHHPMILPFN